MKTRLAYDQDADDPELKKLRLIVSDIHEICMAHGADIGMTLNALVAATVVIIKEIGENESENISESNALKLVIKALTHNMKSPFLGRDE